MTATAAIGAADRATTLENTFSVGATEYFAPYEIWESSSRGPAGSQQMAVLLAKRIVAAPTDNHVVQQGDAEKLSSGFQTPGEIFIFGTRLQAA